MLTYFVTCAVIQFVVSLFVIGYATMEYQSAKINRYGYSFKRRMSAARRWMRRGLVAFVLAPVAALVIPVAVLAGTGYAGRYLYRIATVDMEAIDD